jgi:hypothetical protein
MALESIKVLEERINGFLERHEKVCNEKNELLLRLKEQERAYALLVEQMHQYEKERNEVRDRLENIINKFNGLHELDESEG